MNKCPNCGSTAQMKAQRTEFIEEGWRIKVVRYYTCGCGETLMSVSHCYFINEDETITSYPRYKLQQKLFGKG